MTGYSTSLVYAACTVNYKLDEQQDRDIRGEKILVFLIVGLSMKVDTAKITG